MVRASASRADYTGFESRFRRDFSGSSHTSDFQNGTPASALGLVGLFSVSFGKCFFCRLLNVSATCYPSVSQGRICSDNCTCCHTEIEVADQTFHLTQSQYTDTGPTSPRTDPITPGTWQGSHWSANFYVTGMTRPRNNPSASGVLIRDLPLSRRLP